MTVPAATFRTLHRIHRQLTDLRTRLSRGPKQIAICEENVTRLEAIVEAAKEDVKKSQLQTSQKELQLKERESHIEATRGKLNTANSNREYQTLLEQIAADEQANSVLSDEILELYDKVEKLQGAVVEREAELAKGKADCSKLRGRIEGERESLEQDLARLSNECAELETTIPADVRQDYDRIVGGRGEDGLAAVEGEYCGHCNQAINHQMLNELLLEKNMVLCKSCGAILYLPENREPKRNDS